MLDKAYPDCISASAVNGSSREPGVGSVHAADPQVNDIEGIDAEIAEVVMHSLAQLFRRASGRPAAVGVAPGTDLCHDPKLLKGKDTALL